METIISKGTKSKEISNDLLEALDMLETKLTDFKEYEVKEILIYIDATNGFIFCSGFNPQSNDTIDLTMIEFNLEELWEELDSEGFGAMDFDEIAEESVKKVFKSKMGKKLKSNYKVILENEVGNKIILK